MGACARGLFPTCPVPMIGAHTLAESSLSVLSSSQKVDCSLSSPSSYGCSSCARGVMCPPGSKKACNGRVKRVQNGPITAVWDLELSCLGAYSACNGLIRCVRPSKGRKYVRNACVLGSYSLWTRCVLIASALCARRVAPCACQLLASHLNTLLSPPSSALPPAAGSRLTTAAL